jgi:hypothetical protein
MKELWDGSEPLTDALVRWGTREAFAQAVDERNREEAIRLLCEVGADLDTPKQIVAFLIPG